MSVISTPAAFVPEAFSLKLSVAQRVSASPFGGSEEAVDLLNDRWVASAAVGECTYEEGSQLEAFIGALRGQTNTVALHHFARPAPVGTIRGTLTLNAAAVQGASSLSILGLGPELCANGTFATNTASWAGLNGGVLTRNGLGQMEVAGNGTSAFPLAEQILTLVAGKRYALSFQIVVAGSGVSMPSIPNGDMSPQTGAGYYYPGVPGTYTVFFTAPSSTVALRFVAGSGTSSTGTFDNISVKEAVTDTLKAGDVLGMGGLLVMVASDCTAVAGVITVPITNALRKALSSGTAVTWDKPTALFRLLDTSGVQYRSAVTEPVTFDFGEAI